MLLKNLVLQVNDLFVVSLGAIVATILAVAFFAILTTLSKLTPVTNTVCCCHTFRFFSRSIAEVAILVVSAVEVTVIMTIPTLTPIITPEDDTVTIMSALLTNLLLQD